MATLAGSSPDMGLAITQQEMVTLVRQVNNSQLYNRQLASICQVNGLKSTGVKAELQGRIVQHIQEAYNANDANRFHQIRASVYNAAAKRPSPQKPNVVRSSQATARPDPSYLHPGSAGTGSNGYLNSQHRASPNMPATGSTSGSSSSYTNRLSEPRLTFKSSPFYKIYGQMGRLYTLQAMAQHRSTVSIPLRFNENPGLQYCVKDPNYRVMIFCAGAPNGEQDISFPYQAEIKINGGDFKANLRGLKNKPGSTRPVDITNALRLKSSYTNNIDFTYALTQKPYYLILYICKTTPISDLVKDISRHKIPKDQVIAELNKKAEDPDIVATSQVLSLKCPLSYMRLDIPCRGMSCSHIQCFDATSYLQLQEQGPQWLCPICNKSASFQNLAVDQYVKEILDQTPKSLETVTIDPHGNWSMKASSEEPETEYNSTTGAAFEGAFDDDDDDDLEISEVTPINVGRRLDTPKVPTPNNTTPVSIASSTALGTPTASSSAPRGIASMSTKRPIAQVIDLTLSSDEDDDEPIQRPTKRQNTGVSTSSGIVATPPFGLAPPPRTSTNMRYESESLGFFSESPNGNSFY